MNGHVKSTESRVTFRRHIPVFNTLFPVYYDHLVFIFMSARAALDVSGNSGNQTKLSAL